MNSGSRWLRSAGLAFAMLLFAASASATTFTVHGFELGERITVFGSRSVNTALLDVSLDAMRGESFCVDLDTYISTSAYDVRAVLDPFVDPAPADEAPRDLAWAGFVMNNFGFDVGQLVSATVTRVQAITGVQAAIWEGIYGGNVVDDSSLSAGAQEIFFRILNAGGGWIGGGADGGEPGGGFALEGPAVVVDLANNQDQVFTKPIPEPSAALVFGIGALLVGATRRTRA